MSVNVDLSGGKIKEFKLQNPVKMNLTDCRDSAGTGFVSISFFDEDEIGVVTFVPEPMVCELFSKLAVLMSKPKE